MLIIKEVNATTGEETEREIKTEELAQLELDQEAEAARKAAEAVKAEAKAALLNRLGITEAEAQLLLS